MAETYEEVKMNVSTLTPRTQSSFYGKAKEIEWNGFKYLKSYKTIVCVITPTGEFIRLWNDWSSTTAKHVDEFRINNGMKRISKKDWNKLPVEENYFVPNEVESVRMDYKVTYGMW